MVSSQPTRWSAASWPDVQQPAGPMVSSQLSKRSASIPDVTAGAPYAWATPAPQSALATAAPPRARARVPTGPGHTDASRANVWGCRPGSTHGHAAPAHGASLHARGRGTPARTCAARGPHHVHTSSRAMHPCCTLASIDPNRLFRAHGPDAWTMHAPGTYVQLEYGPGQRAPRRKAGRPAYRACRACMACRHGVQKTCVRGACWLLGVWVWVCKVGA
eukprot:288266-Chlamydomonas_euryale.AAC.1